MTSRPSSGLPFLTAFVVSLSLGTAQGQVQTGPNFHLTDHPASGVSEARRLPISLHAAAVVNKMSSPYDRVIAPEIAEVLKGKKAVSPRATGPQASPGLPGGVNFPGFVSAPYLTLNDGSYSYIANSVTGDFNHDGKPDVAMIREDGTIDVVLNPGPDIASQMPLVSDTGNPLSLQIVSVAVGDMNGDGIPDLVGLDYANRQIVVWISNGNGTFSPPHAYLLKLSAATNPAVTTSMLVGDFNHDGTMDVATLSFISNNSYNSTTVIIEQTLLNNGSGALDPLPEEDTVFHDYYYQFIGNSAVTSSDGVNATGIAFMLNDTGLNNGNNSGNEIIAMASNGDGTFQSPVEPTALPLILQDGQISVYGSVIATNLTAKGPGQPTTDIVFMTGDGAVWDAPFTSGNPSTASILVGADYWPGIFTGLGQLPPALVNNTVQSQQTLLSVADMNGDGLQDLVVYMINGIAIYPNAGKGVFSAPPTQLEGGQGVVQEAQPANYDGSGFNSLVNVDYLLGQVGYIQNLGATGSPQTGQFAGATVPTGINPTNNNAELLGANLWVLATADINGDGILDVIGVDATNDYNLVGSVVAGLSNGSAPGNQTSNYTFTTVINANLAPFNFDLGFVEPVTVKSSAGTSILLVNQQAAAGTNTYLYTMTVTAKGAVSGPTYLTVGAPGLAALQTCGLSLADVGDVNGDGNEDIVIACDGDGGPASGFFAFIGNGDGTFQAGTFTPLGSSLYRVKLINFTGVPGKLDIVGYDSNIATPTAPALDLYLIPNKGDGSGTFDLTKLTKPETNYLISDIVAGDYNSDGKQDLTLLTLGRWDPLLNSTDENTSGVLLLPGNGDYTFGAPTLVATNTYPLSGAYADFNGDGLPDLAMNVIYDDVTANSASSAPSTQVLPNLGDGSFGRPIVEFHSFLPLGDIAESTTFVGAFTKSGGPDLLIGSDYGAALYVNRGVTALGLTTSSATPGQGVPVTLTATITQVMSAGVAPTAAVTFTSNGTLLGSATPNNGVAIFSADSLPVGADTVSATFAGDANHNQATASIGITVAPVTPIFALSSTTPTLSLTQGLSGSVVVTVTANSTFNGVVQLTCTGAPAEVSCTASPARITLTAGQSSVASVFIATTPPNNTTQAESKSPLAGTLGGIAFAGFGFLLWPGRRRLPRVLLVLAFAGLALTSLSGLSGCGGSGNKYPGTVAGNYTLTVTGISGAITQMQAVTLSVTKPAQ